MVNIHPDCPDAEDEQHWNERCRSNIGIWNLEEVPLMPAEARSRKQGVPSQVVSI